MILRRGQDSQKFAANSLPIIEPSAKIRVYNRNGHKLHQRNMAQAVDTGSGSNKPFSGSPKSSTPEDDAYLREALKRCSASTYEAACQFRKTGNTEHLPAIVLGIIERYVEPDLRAKLKDPEDDLRLIEDLGIDSLTMMEIVILVEDVLQMSINNEELRHLRTLGDVKQFIECKVRGLPLPQPTKFLPIEQIASVMPIQPPFLFLNEASVSSQGASAKYKISGQEFFLQGHFKDNPVMPASIMLEALGQLGVLFLLEGGAGEPGKVVNPQTIFFTSCEGVRCHRMCRPGDVLSLSIKPKRLKAPLATFEGAIRVGQDKAAIAEEITLTFGYAEEVAVELEQPAAANGESTPLAAVVNA
jgi:3-hydroxyacyl-[acyl-carrier-protein] dehydratase